MTDSFTYHIRKGLRLQCWEQNQFDRPFDLLLDVGDPLLDQALRISLTPAEAQTLATGIRNQFQDQEMGDAANQ